MRTIIGAIVAAFIVCGSPLVPHATAAVIYRQTGSFLVSSGGSFIIRDFSFTYIASDFITNDLIVPAADLASAAPGILSVSFLPSCPTFTNMLFSCDEVAVTSVGGVRRDRFSDGAFLSDGDYAGLPRRLAVPFHLLVSETQVTLVPAPGSLTLFGLSAIVLAMFRRRPV